MVKLLDPLRVIFWIDLIVVTLYAAPGRNYWEHHFSFLIIERYCDFLPLSLVFGHDTKLTLFVQGHSVRTFSIRGLQFRYFYVFFISFCTNSIVKYWRNFILVVSNHIIKKKVGKSHPQKI